MTKQNDIDACAGEVEAAKLELEQRTQEHADAERDYQAMCAGVANEDADGESTMTLTDQLAEAKETMTVAVTRVKQAEMKIKHLEKVLNTLRAHTLSHSRAQSTNRTKDSKKEE